MVCVEGLSFKTYVHMCPCVHIFQLDKFSPTRPSGPSWSSSCDLCLFLCFFVSLLMSPFHAIFFEASHWSSDHMTSYLQCSLVHGSYLQYNAVQCSAVHCNSVHCRVMQCSEVICDGGLGGQINDGLFMDWTSALNKLEKYTFLNK